MMVKQTLVAASLALLALGLGRPAHADWSPYTFETTEPYGRLVSGRTFLSTPNDPRPKAGLQLTNGLQKDGQPQQSLAITGFGAGNDFSERYGIGGAYANSTHTRHPWEVLYRWNHFAFDGGPHLDSHVIQGKIEVWNPNKLHLPVVSLFGGVNPRSNGFGVRWAAGLAADEAITKKIFVTGQVNWTEFIPDGLSNGLSAIQEGVGATYQVNKRFSVSADYMFENAVDADVNQGWSACVNYAPNRNFVLKAGGGQHESFFGSLTWKRDWSHRK